MTITTEAKFGIKFFHIEDEDDPNLVATATRNPEKPAIMTLSVGDSPVALFPVDDMRAVIAPLNEEEAESEAPEVERHPLATSEKVVRIDEHRTFEVTDRIWEDKTLKIRAGGLGDNLVLDDRENGFHFTLGLATVEAIVEEFGLKPGPELTILTKAEAERAERPEWLEAEVIRADLDSERVFAVCDMDDDWMVYGGERDGDFVMSYEAEDEFSNVEIVKV